VQQASSGLSDVEPKSGADKNQENVKKHKGPGMKNLPMAGGEKSKGKAGKLAWSPSTRPIGEQGELLKERNWK